MADDVGDEKQVKEKKTRHQLIREQQLAELYAIMQTPGGRAFIWRLLAELKISTFGFSGEELVKAEGARRVGAWVIEEVDAAAPKAYSVMRDEATSREVNEKGKNNG
tara:strand:+ start:33 stop:353 length:321 start_codon:yes stop_codon:yes gene_type:complete